MVGIVWELTLPYPVLHSPAGFYNGTQSIALTGAGEIRYTTDGSMPTASSDLYTAPLQITSTTVVRARSFDPNQWPSAVATSTYFIDEPTTLTAVSISLPPDDFSEVYDNYSRKGEVAVEYFDQNKQRQFAGDFAGYIIGETGPYPLRKKVCNLTWMKIMGVWTISNTDFCAG